MFPIIPIFLDHTYYSKSNASILNFWAMATYTWVHVVVYIHTPVVSMGTHGCLHPGEHTPVVPWVHVVVYIHTPVVSMGTHGCLHPGEHTPVVPWVHVAVYIHTPVVSMGTHGCGSHGYLVCLHPGEHLSPDD